MAFVHTIRLAATAALVLVALLVAVPAESIVPPRNCGTITAKGKRYRVKADQVRCKTARSHAQGYMRKGRRPTGYRCKRYSGSSLRAKCTKRSSNPDRVIFIIR